MTANGRKPRVCLLVTSDLTASTFYRGYLSYLRGQGWDVTVAAADEGRLAGLAREEGVDALAVPLRRDPSPMRDLRALSQLVRALRALRPDVVVYATPKAGLLGAVASRLLRIPVRVYQLWGLRFETEKGMRRFVLVTFERAIGWASTHVVANSRSLAEEATRYGIAARIDVLGGGSSHGVDLRRFHPEADDIGELDPSTRDFLAANPDGPLVAFVGRIHRDKGIDTLLDALRLLRGEGKPVRALIVGGLEDAELGEHLEAGREGRATHFVGWVDDTRPYLRVADVLCLPTLREGFPNVILEAAGMRTPSIVSDATGAIDSVLDGVTGKVFPARDSRTLATALWEMTQGGALDSMGRNARAHAESAYSQLHVWELQSEYLRDCVNERLTL